MDTLTQITLGAAVGEACLGEKMGYKAAAWGAALGVLPDLDVLSSPFVTEVQELAIHRGITHSLFFCLLAAPLLGWWLYRRYRHHKTTWREWTGMVFLVILTHIFVDVCTSYGTQVFQPFNDYPLSFNTIFIIDPFYSLPLMAGILSAIFLKRGSELQRWANIIGLSLSTAYLVLGFAFKVHVNSVFEENFRSQQLTIDHYITTPMPLTEFLWVAYARSGDSIHAGLYSLFDDDEEVTFQQVPVNASLIDDYRNDLPVERIIWFSQGYYAVERNPAGLFMHDLRFGRNDLWLSQGPAPFVWSYKLIFNEDSTRVTGFEQLEPSFDFSRERFGKLINRIIGQE